MAAGTGHAVAAGEAIELLSVDLLDAERPTVERLRSLAASLEIGLGWHYLLDLAWILRYAEAKPGSTVMDAGAGTGVIQWYLANEGCHVLSVDRTSRARLSERFRARFPVRGLRPEDLLEPPAAKPAAPTPGAEKPAAATTVAAAPKRAAPKRRPAPVRWVRRLLRSMLRPVRGTPPGGRPGQAGGASPVVTTPPGVAGPTAAATRTPAAPTRPATTPAGGDVVIYNQDLRTLVDIPDGSLDIVVSVSALEHNDPDQLPAVVQELLRVLRPGGRLVATLGASSGEDWYHEPSRGWCYSEATLRRVFGLPSTVAANYADYDRILEDLRGNAELRDNLAAFYFRSGDNGMPWGRWDPQYLSVGVCKVKAWPGKES